ncbi:MAG: C40 family peptidase [Gemmatimonadales bacterium]|nr:C40 family peptidase [Gemmatimonadales bacterium]
MLPQTKREMFLGIAWQFLGKFYSWGGDDPSGFDCSGLVIECAKSVGILPRRGDYRAEDLCVRWGHLIVKRPEIRPGDVVFFGRGGKVSHVEICALTQPDLSIGASGGGSKTKTREDAIRDNAFIKVRPIWGRGSAHKVIAIVSLFDYPNPPGGNE